MLRNNLIRTEEYFYHVTTRSKHQEWFPIPLNKVWEISIEAFFSAQAKCPAIVSQYVLMSNHYHMLIRTPRSDVDQFIHFFNTTFNNMLDDGFRWSLISNEKHFKKVFCYIYQNPRRANLVERCEYYPYSTLFYTSRHLQIPFPFVSLEHLESDLNMINRYFLKFDKIIEL
ncbi:MAG: hypothetical protein A2381_08530 [Bdellovibrionales bacterium RIFOXYB1_FULL_37_110]|nr:MAG: hypothetical protein A2417_14205 [Bdellovibrionales bacterium RIFOXYC1_FULL_37_79]OFZ58251.1 MAG: hypothetical protein A2381_08530 [Bdellovibrionales bacterium RIFOXYB1_FULL_37_110]OFZ65548.1 MAG: hypothetical protein A2577_08280 [Bdellovibrionales bacterium RIFOXYD1_FULL_36_51]